MSRPVKVTIPRVGSIWVYAGGKRSHHGRRSRVIEVTTRPIRPRSRFEPVVVASAVRWRSMADGREHSYSLQRWFYEYRPESEDAKETREIVPEPSRTPETIADVVSKTQPGGVVTISPTVAQALCEALRADAGLDGCYRADRLARGGETVLLDRVVRVRKR